MVQTGRSRPAASEQKRSTLFTSGELGLYPQEPLRHAPSQSEDRLGWSRYPAMTQFRERPQSEGLRELALPLPPLPCPRYHYTPRFLLGRGPMAQKRKFGGDKPEIPDHSRCSQSDFDSQGEVATSFCQARNVLVRAVHGFRQVNGKSA